MASCASCTSVSSGDRCFGCRAYSNFEDFQQKVDVKSIALPGAKPTANPTAPDLLGAAKDTMEERSRQYDQPGGERSMGKCVAAFNIITGRDLQESEGWLLLQILKDVRDRQTPNKPHNDSLVDGVAYSALKAEARMAGK